MSSGNLKTEIPRWWSRRRLQYNRGLLLSIVIAIALYFVLGQQMIEGFEINLHAVLVKLAYGLVFILIANIFYIFAAMIDTRMNWGGIERVSQILWSIVFWFSIAVPFVMPGLILADRYDLYSALGL